MRAIFLLLPLTGCGPRTLEPEYDPNPITRAISVCEGERHAWLYVYADGTQEPLEFTGFSCQPDGRPVPDAYGALPHPWRVAAYDILEPWYLRNGEALEASRRGSSPRTTNVNN